jgi:hypothetical protein
VIVLGDSLFVPAQEDARRFVPPVALLWAALGRLVVQGTDTVAKVDGDTLRADIGRDPAWRATFAGNGLVRLERLKNGRVEESVARNGSELVSYRQLSARRTLRLTVYKVQQEQPFDEAIWRR